MTTAALTAEFDKEAAAIRRLSEEERQEYISALEAQNAAAQELLQTNRESVEQTDVSLDRVLALTGRLSELKEANDGAIASQEEMKAITAELNGMFPELAGSYDGTVGSVDAYVEAVEAAARAEAERQRYEGAHKGMVDANITKATAEAARDDALIKQAEARERLNKAEAAYNAIRKGVGSDQGGQMALQLSTEYKELVAAQEAWQEYSAQVAESQDVLNQAAADLDYYRSIVEAYAEGIYGTGEATDSATGAINNAVGAINALAESYGLAYNAAYESIAGQFALWDEAERVTATSADTMAENIQSQIEYWQEYNKNIDILLSQSGSIEGLSDLIGSFADGSPESVAAIAGLAAASDEDLAAMVADWQVLKAEHKTASSSLADLVVDFTGQMDELTAAVGEDITAMNLSEEAREAARATMQAYLDGVTGMLPEVETAFSAFGGSVLGMLTPSAGAQPENGYASGTHYAHPGWRLVGENGPELAYFGGGEAVLNAQDTAAALAPGSDTVVNLNVELNVAGDVHDPDRLLEDAGQDFERRVRAVLEDVAEQRLRRSYI